MRKPNYRKVEHNANNDFKEGNSLETEIRIAETTKQPIEHAAPIIFTARKDGVEAQYNIRTDRWEIAQAAMDACAKSYQAKRAEAIKPQTETKPSGTEGNEK